MDIDPHDDNENIKNAQIDLIKGERPIVPAQQQQHEQEPKTATGIESAPTEEEQSTELRLSDFQVVDTLGMCWGFMGGFSLMLTLSLLKKKGLAPLDGCSSCAFDCQRNSLVLSSILR